MPVLDMSQTSPTVLKAPVFGDADLVWEQVEERAVRACRSGGVDAAMPHWRRGLAIARERFECSDPRLATSLVNYAFALRRRGDAGLAIRLFAEAEPVFDRSWRWIRRMSPAGGAGRAYDEATLASFGRLAWNLRASARRILIQDELPSGLLERWREQRPTRGSDLRKLLGASLLLASRPGSPEH